MSGNWKLPCTILAKANFCFGAHCVTIQALEVYCWFFNITVQHYLCAHDVGRRRRRRRNKNISSFAMLFVLLGMLFIMRALKDERQVVVNAYKFTDLFQYQHILCVHVIPIQSLPTALLLNLIECTSENYIITLAQSNLSVHGSYLNPDKSTI